jgi:hypothetical protein
LLFVMPVACVQLVVHVRCMNVNSYALHECVMVLVLG